MCNARKGSESVRAGSYIREMGSPSTAVLSLCIAQMKASSMYYVSHLTDTGQRMSGADYTLTKNETTTCCTSSRGEAANKNGRCVFVRPQFNN